MATIQKSIYDMNGNLSVQYSVNSYGKIVEKNIYAYGDKGIYLSEKSNYSTSGVISVSYKYDKSGNATSVILYNARGAVSQSYWMSYSGGNLANKYTYNAAWKLSEYNAYNSDGTVANTSYYNNGALTESIAYKYDANKSVIEKDFSNAAGAVTEKDYFSNGIVTEKDFYKGSYIAQKDLYTNGLISQTSLYSNGSLYQGIAYIYNDSNTIIEKDYTNASGVILEKDYLTSGVITEKDLYTNGVLTEKDFYNSKKVMTAKYIYDTNGNATSAIWYDSRGAVYNRLFMSYNGGNLASTYIYNAAWKLTESSLYNTDGTVSNAYSYKNGVLLGGVAFTYDGNKNIIEKDYSNAAGAVLQKDYITNGIITERDYLSGGNVVEKDYLNSNGGITEKDYLTNGVITEKDYLKDGLVATKYLMSNGSLSEIDTLDTKGKITSRSFYTNNSLTEADFYTAGVLVEKDFYTNNTKTSADIYTKGALSARVYYTNNQMTEKDLFTNGVIKEKDLYANNVLTEKDYLTNGKVTEKDYYTNNVVTKRDYYDGNGNITNTTGNVTISPIGTQVYEYGQATLWSKYLDYSQGDNSKGYKYDCGLAACENVLIEAGTLAKRAITTIVNGIDTIESMVVNYAAANGLCITSNSNPYYNGGTYGSWQASILAHFGVTATDQYATIEGIASAIKNNACVIAEVDAYQLWGVGRAGYANHAITVTGVDYSATNSNQIDGFYICDSGRGSSNDAARFVSTSLMTSIFSLNNYNGQMVGEAVITGGSGKQLLASASGAIGAFDSSVDINQLIQQMASFTTGADQQVIGSIDNHAQQQTLQTLVPSAVA